MREAMKEMHRAVKKPHASDLYKNQMMSNLFECLTENLRQTKFKAFALLKSSTILKTH